MMTITTMFSLPLVFLVADMHTITLTNKTKQRDTLDM